MPKGVGSNSGLKRAMSYFLPPDSLRPDLSKIEDFHIQLAVDTQISLNVCVHACLLIISVFPNGVGVCSFQTIFVLIFSFYRQCQQLPSMHKKLVFSLKLY